MKTSLNNNNLINRGLQIANESISRLQLNLENLKVLTEVGSGYYSLAPVIAAMSNAEKVMAWTFDSENGTALQNIAFSSKVLQTLGLEGKVEFHVGKMNTRHLHEADIITNTGFLRPLDRSKLLHCKSDAVIPLMFEKWELRHQDVDIEYCTKRGIKVGGTREDHPLNDVFKYIGPMAIKISMDAGFEVMGNKIIVWSDDKFGQYIARAFKKIGARSVIQTVNFEVINEEIFDTDFVFFADYSESRNYTGDEFFYFNRLLKKNPHFGVIHLYGQLDYSKILNSGLLIYPLKNGISQKMSLSFHYLGSTPVVNLISAGLKVGELMKRNTFSDLIQPINF